MNIEDLNKVFGPTPVNSEASKTNYLLIGLSISVVLVVGILINHEMIRRKKEKITVDQMRGNK